MVDSSLPFRPKSSAERALGNVEIQTLRVRRRINRFTLQRVLYLALGASLLAFSTLVALAFVLHGRSWAALVWSVAVGLAVLLLASARGAFRAWIRRPDAAVVIDHRAGLEDRLSTLTALGGATHRSRLWDFLLHENLRLLPHWEPARMQSRAVPRSVWFFLASLLLAALTLGVHPGLLGHGGPIPGGRSGENPLVGSEAGEAGETASSETDDSGSLLAELPEKIRQAIVGTKDEAAEAGSARGGVGSRDSGGPSIATNQLAGRAGSAKSAPAGSGQDLRSQAPGTEANRPPSAGAPKQGPANPSQAPSASAKPSSQPARGEGPKALERVEVGRSPQQPNRRPQGKGQPSGGSGGGGSGLGGDPSGLYGDKDAPGKASGSFALDLNALQNRQPSKDGEEQGAAARPASRLGAEQRLDDAIRRAQVPAEYEKIVQRIFNRGEETENGGARP